MDEKILAIKNPAFSNAEGTAIDVTMIRTDFGAIPFTATENDTEETGREIYAAAMAGEYGEIAPYVVIIPPMEEVLFDAKRELVNRMNAAVTAIITLQSSIERGRAKPSDPDTLIAYQEYLCDLRAMTDEQLQQSPASFPVAPAGIYSHGQGGLN